MRSRLKGLRHKITPADIFVFILLLALSVSGLLFIKEVMPKGTGVTIDVDGKQAYTLPLQGNSTTNVQGVNGITVVEIINGKVRVKDSDCPGKLCVKQGWIDRGAIVCLPNRVIVRLNNGHDSSRLDAITR
jgi:hypothetical protein